MNEGQAKGYEWLNQGTRFLESLHIGLYFDISRILKPGSMVITGFV